MPDNNGLKELRTALNEHNKGVTKALGTIDKNVGIIQNELSNLNEKVDKNMERIHELEGWTNKNKGAVKVGVWIVAFILTVGTIAVSVIAFFKGS